MENLNDTTAAVEHARVEDAPSAPGDAPEGPASIPEVHGTEAVGQATGPAEVDEDPAPAFASLSALSGFLAGQGTNVNLGAILRSKYIGSPRDGKLKNAIDDCLRVLASSRGDDVRQEGRGIAVLAASGAGKTKCIRRALRLHPLFAETGINKRGSRAVSVVCTGSCTLRILGEELLKACTHEIKEGLRENEVWRQVRAHLKLLGILVVHVDEVSNLTENAHDDDRKRIVNNFKALINNPDWPVVLVLSGVPSLGPVLRKDQQLARRLRWIELEPLSSPEDNLTLAKFAKALCSAAGIAPLHGFDTTVAARLVHGACNQLGLAAEMCVEAVENAVDANHASLDISHFAAMFAGRTGCDALRNPFVTADWMQTDPRVALGMVDEDEDEDDEPPKCGRRPARGRKGRKPRGARR